MPFEIVPAPKRLCQGAPSPRKPRPEEGENGVAATTWTPDRCANMIVGEIFMTAELGELLVGGLDPPGIGKQKRLAGGALEIGFAYPCSVHLVRAVENLRPSPVIVDRRNPDRPDPPHLEVCQIHIGRYIVCPDGFERTLTCGEPRKPGVFTESTYGQTFIARESQGWDAQITGMPIFEFGFEYDLSSYQTPVLQEQVLYSAVPFCGTRQK